MERSNGRAGPPAHIRSIQHAAHGRIGRTALRRDGGAEKFVAPPLGGRRRYKHFPSKGGTTNSIMKAEKQRSKPIRVLVVAAPPDWRGGQAVQPARLLYG